MSHSFFMEAAKAGVPRGTGNKSKGKGTTTNLRTRIMSAGTAVAVLFMTSGLPEALAAPKATNSISIVPTITSVALVDGVLTATGVATAVVNGVTTTQAFT